MLLSGGTYKVSFRGHTDEDKVISNPYFLSFRSLFGSRMYGPPTGFSYMRAAWVSLFVRESSDPNSASYSFLMTYLSLPSSQLSLFLFLFTYNQTCCVVYTLDYSFIFHEDRKGTIWERSLEVSMYRRLNILIDIGHDFIHTPFYIFLLGIDFKVCFGGVCRS